MLRFLLAVNSSKKIKMITPNRLAEIIVKTISGREVNHPKVININKKSLSTNGDLSFQLKLNYWRGYVDTESEYFKNSENILQYYQHFKHGQNDNTLIDKILEIFVNDVNEQLNCSSDSKQHQVTMKISNNFVIVNYVRPHAACFAIKAAIEKRSQYGIKSNKAKSLSLTVECDSESEMTNERLKLQKQVSENLLKCHGCEVLDSESETNYVFTNKSEGHTKDNHVRYVCGAVLNSNKKKEKDLKISAYAETKVEKIKYLSAQRMSDLHISQDNFEKDVLRIANASINHEFLSTKYSSPVVIDESDDVDRFIKEASFVLYNNVRINAILDKYSRLVKDDKFSQILPIEQINSFDKTTDDDSWLLVYNYIIKYSDILESLVITEPKLEVNIHFLWSFVSSLCHDFSKYYRRNRILLRGSETNSQMIMIATERLHMLRALGVVLSNSLSLLNIEEVAFM